MKLEHKFEQLQLLYELTQAVNRADEPGEIYRAAVEGLVRVVAADRASVMIFDTDGVMRYKAWKAYPTATGQRWNSLSVLNGREVLVMCRLLP